MLTAYGPAEELVGLTMGNSKQAKRYAYGDVRISYCLYYRGWKGQTSKETFWSISNETGAHH